MPCQSQSNSARVDDTGAQISDLTSPDLGDETGWLRSPATSSADLAGSRRSRFPDQERDGGGNAALEPWHEAVSGSELLTEVSSTFTRYLVLPESAADAMALWVAHTYVYDEGQVTPRLALLSDQKRCGKTIALTILHQLVSQPLSTAHITAPALFRSVDQRHQTLLIDEADTFLRGSQDLIGILNSGHFRASASVTRVQGRFSTWAPAAIAMIGDLPDTLEDRSIVIPMRRQGPEDTVERLRLDRMEHLQLLTRRMLRWTTDNLESLGGVDDPAVPDEIHSRAADNWRPLLTIANLAGGVWPERARQAALRLSTADEGQGGRPDLETLVTNVRSVFAAREANRISSTDLCAALAGLQGRPWSDWNGRAITPHGLASLLRPVGIHPRPVRIGSRTPRGYHRENFEGFIGQRSA